MHRRFFLPMLLCLPLPGLVWAAPERETEADAEDQPPKQPSYKVSAAQLQAGVAQRFPLRYPVAGLMNLDVQVPTLRLLPALNRLNATMVVEAAGPALNRSHQGTLDVEFALRYEATDRTVRAHQLRLARLQFPSLQPSVVALLNTYGPALAERTLLEVVVHTLRPQDLALPDTLGMQPGSITVTNEGLTIGFVPKSLS
ncbi:hypothetical protein [Rhodoferax saidenbachensis]|uniref:DUF1439 domain-containing protein n=2 Tax=Rhodoferax saidenbachensis TaxID=1484693 RepID=A0A1P8KG96_9BURK|nr:hypothetical protein [Rhodoferax saidenbachensis]APW45011.1 DUF1439 domain-containing protein [Rhodoferax saidenbachensis]